MHWDETTYPFSSPLNGIFNINSGDGVNYSLNLPMIAEPGETWLYNTGASHLLAAIVAQASGNTTLDFAEEHLFGPLGISDVRWYRDLAGWYKGGFDLKIRTRDMAKFGWLFLNNGTWDGEQIISQEWVNTSTATHTQFGENHGYGYQWWTIPSFNIYYAAGLYGQYIFVIPDYDIVVAFNSAMGQVAYPHIDYVLNYVLTSIDGYTPRGSEPDPLEPLVLATGLVVAVVVVLVLFLYMRRKT
jgi:CubicO group peptidase (beta-lactamase class C family)